MRFEQHSSRVLLRSERTAYDAESRNSLMGLMDGEHIVKLMRILFG